MFKVAAARVLLALIRTYQVLISPILPNACRFYPSCSQYAYQAVAKYGPFKGTRLAVLRLLRCHPYHPGGYDPVP
ncbi:MAG: membrane protein insertion efficiency factor YidD [Pseudomonadota bacterium]